MDYSALTKFGILANIDGLCNAQRKNGVNLDQAEVGYSATCREVTTMERSNIQSTLFISTSKGPAETLRDIHTLTYQMCRIEENIKQTTKFHK